ncbi:MAG: GntR family transcriptional regulator [Bacteroidota bacterium]|nr:GntR family transcriptional regulator [Bacteroidota bacterium]
MRKNNFLQHIHLDDRLATPKYRQLADSIMHAFQQGKLGEYETTLPSISELSIKFEISRDTAERGYRRLKRVGIIGSVPGKGYYIKRPHDSAKIRVLLFFNKLSVHKKTIYDSISASLSKNYSLDLCIHDGDFSFFTSLLKDKIDEYAYYVIIPHFTDGEKEVANVINSIDKNKLILLDKLVNGVTGNYGAVYENFEHDIYSALEKANERLRKYSTLKIIFPRVSYLPKEILKGFFGFCQDYKFNSKLVHDIQTEPLKSGDVFISLDEEDLIILIERIFLTGLQVGKNVGLISYNETSFKRIMLNGITTISTDFKRMGEKAAQLILCNAKQHIEVPFKLILRDSL